MKRINKIYLTRRDNRNLEYASETEFGLDFFFKKKHIIICDILNSDYTRETHDDIYHTLDKDNDNIKILAVLKNYSIYEIEYEEHKQVNQKPIEEERICF